MIRFKSVVANLILAVFCFGWPVFLAAGSSSLGFFIGLFLWPLGGGYLWAAATLKIDDSLRPRPTEPDPVRYDLPPGRGSHRPASFDSLLAVIEQVQPRWNRSSQVTFARIGAKALGATFFDGTVPSPEYSRAMSAYFATRRDPITLVPVLRDWPYFDGWSGPRVASSPDACEVYQAVHPSLSSQTAGFVVLEPKLDSGEGIIYELGVLRSYRRAGLGGLILDASEDILWARGDMWALLRPQSTDREGPNNEVLRAWYISRGYEDHPLGSSFLRKRLL